MSPEGDPIDPPSPRVPVDPDLGETDPAQPAGPRRPVADGGRRGPSRLRPATLGVIALGGAAGTCARVGIAQALSGSPTGFPWATLTVNVTGSLVLGLVMVLVLERLPPTRLVRPLLATGLCGAYTTFSTFATEIDLLLRAGRLALALLYVAASLALGLLAVLAGMGLGRWLPLGTRAP